MAYQVLGEDGQPIDAYAEVDPLGITLHSRGGSSEGGTVQNADYASANSGRSHSRGPLFDCCRVRVERCRKASHRRRTTDLALRLTSTW